MKYQSMGTVYLIALGAFALGMASYVIAGLVPMIVSDFSVSVARAGQLVTAFTLAYGIGSPVFVALLPANKQRLGLLIALAIFTVANLVSALVTTYTALVVSRIFAGVGAGVYLAMGIAASAAVVPKDKRGQALAIIMGGMASGTVLGVPAGLMIAEQLGWASTMWLIAILGLVSMVSLAIKLPALPASEASTLREKFTILKDMKVTLILTVSLLAAVSSLGLYTYIAPIMANESFGGISNITPWLWVWGIGGVVGSFLIGPIADRVSGPKLVAIIMLMLTVSLAALPFTAGVNAWLAMVPIAIWGAVGWALQVPQNNQLISAREGIGGGNVAVALNESALYLGSAIGAAAGGLIFAFQLGGWALPFTAASIAGLGLLLQLIALKSNGIFSANKPASCSSS
ncbi:MFS transporter [Vreelandella profundi]|uniref:MFS transporter n=1 Tax=Vreelandella profundi TaxID=2852117 RepID=UPI001EF0C460|nr:MFS transporter [Halomonas profundi]